MAYENKTETIEGETFNHFRNQTKKIYDAIHFLVKFNYQVIDLENKWINKSNVDELEHPFNKSNVDELEHP
jgi:hypothetical protein